MTVLETRALVADDGELRIVAQAPPDVPPGTHRAILVIEDETRPPRQEMSRDPLRLKLLDLSAWPANASFRREDLYGDDGR